MITGEANYKREAILPLYVLDINGATTFVDAVIDTGFTDSLMIEETLATSLNLVPARTRAYQLGDGSEVELQRYLITLDWNGVSRTVTATESVGGGTLIGMKLLRGYSLTIDVVDGGAVRLLRMD